MSLYGDMTRVALSGSPTRPMNAYIHRDERSDDEGIVVLFMLMSCYEEVVSVPTYDPQHIADD